MDRLCFMRRRTSPAPSSASFTITGEGGVDVEAEWARFASEHADWPAMARQADPLYRLPEPTIEVLSRAENPRGPFIEATAASAERDLSAICEKIGAVGFLRGRPIRHPLLVPDRNTRALVDAMDWSPEMKADARRALALAQPAAARMKGYVGRLMTDPEFLHGVETLQKHWSELPRNERPDFPLRRAAPTIPGLVGMTQAAPATSGFQMGLEKLLDHWGLIELATWDLPHPQGPLIPCLLPPGAPALPRHGLHIVIPLWYPMIGDDEIQKRILEQQRSIAASLELDSGIAGLPHHALYAQMLDVILLEKTIRDRYGMPPRRAGFVTRMEDAIAAGMHVSRDQIKKLRKAISMCLRGNRDKVKFLRPPKH